MKNIFLLYFLISFQFAFSQECKKTVIYFKNNKDYLSKEAQSTLDSVVNSLGTDQRYLIELYGHTDDKHSEEYNSALGMQRVMNVKSHIENKRRGNIIWLKKSYGESKPLTDNENSKRRKLNRRVEVFVVRLDSSGGFTIKGSDKTSVFVTYKFFERCGYCEANARLTEREKISDTLRRKTYDSYLLKIYTDCRRENACYEVVFRIPYEIFNSSEKVKVPFPLEFRGCGGGPDSMEINPMSKNFSVSYDTLKNEYILKIPCFNPHHSICCAGMISHCRALRLEFPPKLKFHHLRYYVATDSFASQKDFTTMDLCLDQLDIFSIGKIEDQYVHVACNLDSLITDRFIDPSDLSKSRYVATILEKYYLPFAYKKTKLFIKTPKKISFDTVGFYVNEYDYIIPINEKCESGYTASMLDYRHFIGVTVQGQRFVLSYQMLKQRYNKRKDRVKVKIRKKFLRHLFWS